MKADPLSPQAEVQTSACDLLPERLKTGGIVERTASEQNLDAAARRLKKTEDGAVCRPAIADASIPKVPSRLSLPFTKSIGSRSVCQFEISR